ncbi:MAG TPA: general stress protein [Ktedonobacterales bacterium]|nr:general stress protein [Ktedonobacterales bacterium]
MARSIAGLFPDRASAEQAIADLKAAGFDPSHMGIVMRDRQETREVASDQGINSTTGAVTGSAIGGTAGAILAATGAFVIPGIGPFISGGILATALAGGAAGWLIGGLVGLGFPHEEAQYYQGRVEQGSTLLTVDAPGREMEAQQIMFNNGAEDLRAQGYSYSDTTTAAPMPPNATPVAPTPTTGPNAVVNPAPQRSYPTDADIIAERNAERAPEMDQSETVDPKTGLTREQEDQPSQTGLL